MKLRKSKERRRTFTGSPEGRKRKKEVSIKRLGTKSGVKTRHASLAGGQTTPRKKTGGIAR